MIALLLVRVPPVPVTGVLFLYVSWSICVQQRCKTTSIVGLFWGWPNIIEYMYFLHIYFQQCSEDFGDPWDQFPGSPWPEISSKFKIYMYLGVARRNSLPVTLMTRSLYGNSGGWFQWSLLPVYKIRWLHVFLCVTHRNSLPVTGVTRCLQGNLSGCFQWSLLSVGLYD